VRLMGLENNKAAHHIKISEDPNTRITHIGWASTALSNHSSISIVPDSLQSEIKGSWNLDGSERSVDLPRELTFLEIDSALPKLSPLPSSSAGSRFVNAIPIVAIISRPHTC
jgi:anaphase-promoting complex subunit 4